MKIADKTGKTGLSAEPGVFANSFLPTPHHKRHIRKVSGYFQVIPAASHIRKEASYLYA